ncbi:MAG TPA: choice-of-anchor Q domain-containing protein, partial [Gemmataceae bacterium]|nr:choice-of-anchor Q domain-containing protein [Gemmataceae bacterium]
RTISLLSALPTITDSLTIIGPVSVSGQALLTVRRESAAATQFRVFDIVGPVAMTVSLSNMAVSGGSAAGSGGGIYDRRATLDLTNMLIAGNSASGYGGGIYAGFKADVALLQCTVAGNTAAGGGGLYIGFDGRMSVTACTVSGNSATGKIDAGGGGGGLYAYYGAVLILTDCTVSHNSSGSWGGGIVGEAFNTVDVTDTTVSDNTAKTGGGLAFRYATAGQSIVGSTISGNSAIGTGGGIYIRGIILGDDISVNDSTIADNTAYSGGGIGLAFWNGTLEAQNSTISANAATGTSAVPGQGGGGIALTSVSTFTSATAEIDLVSAIIAANTAANRRPDIATPIAANAIVYANNSLIGAADAGFALSAGSANNLTGTVAAPFDPKLAPLGNYGGLSPTVALLPNSPAIDAGINLAGLTSDQRGLPRVNGPAPDMGAYEYYAPITVAGIQINDGSAQRSEVRSITVTFSNMVSFAAGNTAAAFRLTHVQTGNDVILSAAVSTDAQGRTVVTLGFSGSETDPVSALNGGIPSLADGRYSLTIFGSAVTGAFTQPLDGNADGTPGGDYLSPADAYHGTGLRLFRLFGDANGDGVIDTTDLSFFRAALFSGTLIPYLDADNSGAVDFADLGQFRVRYTTNVF